MKLFHLGCISVVIFVLSACNGLQFGNMSARTEFAHSQSLGVKAGLDGIQSYSQEYLKRENVITMLSGHGGQASKGSYEDFLTALRTFESSIDPTQAQYYKDNYNNPLAMSYQKVETDATGALIPGRVVRDDNGHPLIETTSIKKYFEKIGVDDLYNPDTATYDTFITMQYSVINFIGFVGYQFSEQDLWVLGYYTHYDDTGLKEYYVDVDDSNWAHGVRDKVMDFPDGRVHVTDVNTWGGVFTGKHGIYSMDDFKDPTKQDFIAKDHFQFKYNNIVTQLAAEGKTIKNYLGTSLFWDQCIPPISPPPGGRKNEVIVTMSGLLAGAHLRGAAGVVDLLVRHKNNADEIGTTILQYVEDYAGYDTPFGEVLSER